MVVVATRLTVVDVYTGCRRFWSIRGETERISRRSELLPCLCGYSDKMSCAPAIQLRSLWLSPWKLNGANIHSLSSESVLGSSFCHGKMPALRSSVASSPVTEPVKAEDSVEKLRNLCYGHVPEHILCRMEEVGFSAPTDIQREALPVLFSGRDCILHAQTGSGKTLTYLLLIFSVVNTQRSAIQGTYCCANKRTWYAGHKSCTDAGCKAINSWVRAEAVLS